MRSSDEVGVVKIIECPRDAWQGLPGIIPAPAKAAYLQRLVTAGFRHIDAVSFVSPAAVPQMADPEEVLRIFRPLLGTEIIGIVTNVRGAERAVATGAVQTLGYPYSVSEQFLQRNQRQTQAEALRALAAITDLANANGLNMVAYISMAFGNPYGEAWSSEVVTDACGHLADLGVKTISLADTIGAGGAAMVADIVSAALATYSDVEFGVHLHARPGEGAVIIRSAYKAGCRRFDSTIGGLGGCPFAQDDLIGNIGTEMLVQTLLGMGAELPDFVELGELGRVNEALVNIAR